MKVNNGSDLFLIILSYRHYLQNDLPHIISTIIFTKKCDILIKIDDMTYS